MRPTRLAALAAAALAIAPAGSASAAQIWAEYASGTTDDITAVDYVSATDVWYGTATGRILRNGVGTPVFDTPSVGAITDIAAAPGGTVGLATTANGKLLRTTNGGANWAEVAGLTSYAYASCDSTGPFPLTAVSGELTAIDWASATVAYVVGANPAMVLRTTNAGANWAEVNKQADGTCKMGRINSATPRFTDVDALSVGDVWFVKRGFGERQHTFDDFASGISQLGSSSNSGEAHTALSFDPSSPARSYAASRHAGGLAFQTSTDSGVSYDDPQYLAGDPNAITSLTDVEARDGSATAVGAAGTILVSPNPAQAFFQPAPGVATDWNAVDKLDGTRAIVGGQGGRMVISSQASSTTDVVPPTGTIAGPATAVVGVPTRYTATATDDRAIDTASFQWRGGGAEPTGVAAADGNPADVVFTLPGTRILTVTFRDQEGNAGTASKTVTVSPAPAPAPGGGTATVRPGTPTPRPTASTTVGNSTVTLGGPKTCVRPRGSFTATLSVKKRKRKGAKVVKISKVEFFIDKRRVKTDRKAPFRQRLTVRTLRPGTKHELRARAFIKVRKGRKVPKKSVRVSFSVCSS